jgi:Xaa-Pro aminopeptidase
MLSEARAGITGGELWELANDVAVQAGFGDWSNHVYLGHTTGITTSSRPVVARGETGELRPGSFVNVEPGIFVPGTGSACIENTLYVTDSGASPINGFDIGIQIV